MGNTETKKKQYQCDICDEHFHWDSESAFWGSPISEEHGELLFICSEECRQELKNPARLFKKKYGHSCSKEYYRKHR